MSVSRKEVKSVRSAMGDRALVMDSQTCMSCQVGIKWITFLSELSTSLTACSCSMSRETIFSIEPHSPVEQNAAINFNLMWVCHSVYGCENSPQPSCAVEVLCPTEPLPSPDVFSNSCKMQLQSF